MIVKSLYWNYYNLNVTNTKLNQIFKHIEVIRKDRNARRKASWHHRGIAKMAVLDLQLKKRLDLSKLAKDKDKYYKKIQDFKHKHTNINALQPKQKKRIKDMQKKYDGIDAKKKALLDKFTKAFFKAKKLVKHVIQLSKEGKFSEYDVPRKANCFNKVKGYLKQFIPMYTKTLNLRSQLRKAIKAGKKNKIIAAMRKKFHHSRVVAFEVYSKAKACQSDVHQEYNILNGIDPPKPCENHTKAQCQDKFQKEIDALQKKVNIVTPIWGNVKNHHYTEKNVKAMVKLIGYRKQIQEKTWAMDDCEDSHCDVKPNTGKDKPKKPLKCLKDEIKKAGVCVKKPKCVPETKQTCIAKYNQKIKDNQNQIHDAIITVDKLKKDKSKAIKLKEAQVNLLKLKKDTKHLQQK